jgi:hypothetical protein
MQSSEAQEAHSHGGHATEPWLSGCQVLSGDLSVCRAAVRHCQVPLFGHATIWSAASCSVGLSSQRCSGLAKYAGGCGLVIWLRLLPEPRNAKWSPVVPPNHRDGQRRQPSHLLAGSAARQRAHHRSRERRFGADGTHARACAASSGAVGPRDVHSLVPHQCVSIREDMHVGITTI